MSKWINKNLFNKFQEDKIKEKETADTSYIRSALVWQSPEKGTTEHAKVYVGRFLPDPKGEFYKRYFYHFWNSGEKWIFVLCPKTHDYKSFCPFCSVTAKLYNGTKEDKRQGYLLKKKERNVANFYVRKDFRDDERSDENKVVNTVKLYEFPGKVEQKVKKEITNTEQGYGADVFDPGEHGRDFILNVLATKKDDNGKSWPDYSTSEFSRKQEALGTDEEINEIMKNCVDLKGYIESMESDKDDVVEILKSEFLWDLVETECLNNGYKDVESGKGMKEEEMKEEEMKEDEVKKEVKEEKIEKKIEKEEKIKEEKIKDEVVETSDNKDVDDLSDDDLLAELDNM